MTDPITFLFTDIEGSTELWELHEAEMSQALVRHDELVRASIERHGGQVFKTVGDAFCAAFPDPMAGALAACQIQCQLIAEEWPTPRPIRVRMALHSGVAEARENDFFGPTLNRIARLLSLGHGGQILISSQVEQGISASLPEGMSVLDLGRHRLKDVSEPEHVFQIIHMELPFEFPPLRSLSVLLNNLPPQLTSFVGRAAELERIQELLRSNRLLTLIGSGGCGKTRLALQAALDHFDRYPQGVWLVELAPLSDEGLIGQTVASALRLRLDPSVSPIAKVIESLQGGPALLLLDNCEHLLSGCAHLAVALLQGCPDLKIMATSREPIHVPGEQTWRVPSLASPDPDGSDDPAVVGEFESVRLFVDRAILHKPGFAVDSQNAKAVAQICHRLNGIPLAIELAAARSNVLNPEQIASRLDDQFRLLTGGNRAALPRQQTLRATIDWSYDLLESEDRVLLDRLSIFRGGWVVEAAEQVCAGGPIDEFDVLDRLSHLVDKSLVAVEDFDNSPRYSLLDSIRSYAREKLEATDGVGEVTERHAGWSVDLAEEGRKRLEGPDQPAWMRRLERESGNVRAALDYLTSHEGRAEDALRLATGLTRFWYVRGQFEEGAGWLEKGLRSGDSVPSELRATALYAAGICANEMGKYQDSMEKLRQSMDIHRADGNLLGVANALNAMGIVSHQTGQYVQAKSFYEEALEINRELGNRSSEARVLNNLGIVANSLGDRALARSLYEEALKVSRELGNRSEEGLNLNNLGNVLFAQEDLDGAEDLFRQALEISREVSSRAGEALNLNNLGQVLHRKGDTEEAQKCLLDSLAIRREQGDRLGMAFTFEGLARVAASEEEPEDAVGYLAAAASLRAEIGSPLAPADQRELDDLIAALKSEMGQPAFDAAWERG